MFTKKSDGDFTDAIGFIFAIALIFGFIGMLGGGTAEVGRKRPWLLAVILLAAVGGGYYYFSGGEEPAPAVVVATSTPEVAVAFKKDVFCFEGNGVRGAMVAMDGETVVIKDGVGKLHTYRNDELRTVACEYPDGDTMIESDHQLKITRREAGRFEEAIAKQKAAVRPEGVAPVIWKAQIEGMESMLSTLRREISEYVSA
jgi:hypothetical protein